MHKWKSNYTGLTEYSLDDNDVTYAKSPLGNVQDPRDKVLGIIWNKTDDTLKFNLEETAR